MTTTFRVLLAEFLGTFLLCFIGIAAILSQRRRCTKSSSTPDAVSVALRARAAAAVCP